MSARAALGAKKRKAGRGPHTLDFCVDYPEGVVLFSSVWEWRDGRLLIGPIRVRCGPAKPPPAFTPEHAAEIESLIVEYANTVLRWQGIAP